MGEKALEDNKKLVQNARSRSVRGRGPKARRWSAISSISLEDLAQEDEIAIASEDKIIANKAPSRKKLEALSMALPKGVSSF